MSESESGSTSIVYKNETSLSSSPSTSTGRIPAAYIPHGGGPMPILGDAGHKTMVEWLGKFASEHLSKNRPKSCLVLSAHWEEKVPTIQSGDNGALLFDYFGFPKKAYDIKYPVKPAKELATRVTELLTLAGIPNGVNKTRGFDHGVFIPLMLIYPEANLPTVQLSQVKGLKADVHIKLGEALAPLRDEGVFIIGSGMSYHNMQGFGDSNSNVDSEPFHKYLRDTLANNGNDYEAKAQMLKGWEKAPKARMVHPREEHLMPLMTTFGSSVTGGGKAKEVFYDNVGGVKCAGYVFE